MIYILLGERGASKEQRIFDIRDKVLPSQDARKFDYEVLSAHKLSPAILKERLIALPTLAPHRLVVLHDCEDLSPQNKKLVIDFVASNPGHLVLVLTSDSLTPKDSFIEKIKSSAKVVDFGQKAAISVFDMTNALDRRQPAEALQVLTDLLADGQHPLQIMGGMIWFWRQKKNRVSTIKFEAGLQALQEADLNIKRSRLLPEYAMEKLVVELGMLLG